MHIQSYNRYFFMWMVNHGVFTGILCIYQTKYTLFIDMSDLCTQDEGDRKGQEEYGGDDDINRTLGPTSLWL